MDKLWAVTVVTNRQIKRRESETRASVFCFRSNRQSPFNEFSSALFWARTGKKLLLGLILGIHKVSKYFKRRLNKSKKLLLLTVRVDCRELEGECHKCNNYFVSICCNSLFLSLSQLLFTLIRGCNFLSF